MPNKNVILLSDVEPLILDIRGQRVMLDEDLARLYGVETKRLNEQVKRNIQRFPSDFSFQLSFQEFRDLKSQSATSSWGGRRKPPYAFTEHGALMAANVLYSETAIAASVQIVRAFLQLRQLTATHEKLSRKLAALEKKYDQQFKVVFDAIRDLMTPPENPRRRIGFESSKK